MAALLTALAVGSSGTVLLTLAVGSSGTVMGRRSALLALGAAPLALPRPALAALAPGDLDFLSPTSYLFKRRKRQQEACYAEGACADPEPYYSITCARDDDACLARKRRLAAEELESFKADPLGSPAILLVVVAAFVPWIGSAIRSIRRSLDEKQDP